MEAGRLDPVSIQRTLKQIYRLFRVGTFHQINNDAIRAVIDETRAILEEIRREDVKEITLLFDGETVLVNSQMLRASREVYETSREFGTFLESRGVNLLSLSTSADSQDLQELVAFFLDPSQKPSVEGEVKLSERVTLRQVEPGMLVGFEDEGLHPVERVLLVYALTVLVLRRLHESVMAEEYSLAGYFKRLARQIAQINYAERPVVLDVILAAHLSTDDAKRTANAAIIAAAMVRQTGVSEATTARVVMTTLMSGVGTARQRSHYFDGSDPLSALLHPISESDRQHEPDGAAAAVIRLGTLRGEAALRSIVVRDARARLQGDADGAWQRLFESRVVATARRFIDTLTGAAIGQRSPGLVLEALRAQAADALDHLCLDLLTNGIRIYPAGTAVELSSGWLALVLDAPSKPSEFDRPTVLICHGPDGAEAAPREVDLLQREHAALGHVKRIAEPPTPAMERLRAERIGTRWRGDERNASVADWRQQMSEQHASAETFRTALAQETDQEANARNQARRADAEVFAATAVEGRRKFGLLTNINKGAAHLSVRGTTAFLKITGPLDPRLTATVAEPVVSAGGLRSAVATTSTGSHEAVGGEGGTERESARFAAVRGSGSHPLVRRNDEGSGAYGSVESRQTGSFTAAPSMPSDPLAAGATYGSRQSGSFPAAAHRSGSHAAAIPAEDTLPMTTALSADEGLPVSEQLPEAQPEVAPSEPLNAADVIRRRLGQTAQLSATASVTGREATSESAGSQRPRTAAIPPGLDPESVLRVEVDQLAPPPSPPPTRATAALLRKYARRIDAQPAATPATADATSAPPADLDALLAAYLGDKKP
ncbi:MAG: hypothetical protein HQ461_09060 [Deltaproteobacteria bacterium]|nr:hypothetical protein [Deltaproteobacteria bacterium]